MQKRNDFVSYAYNFAVWETQSTDRAETLALIDEFLDPSLTLITVQLGENVSDLSTYESDFEYLLNYLHKEAPNAEILVVSDFWDEIGRDEAKLQAVTACDVQYVDISSIKENNEYMAGLGYEVIDENGEKHIVEHNGVARYPNDIAMKYIAESLLSEIAK